MNPDEPDAGEEGTKDGAASGGASPLSGGQSPSPSGSGSPKAGKSSLAHRLKKSPS